MATYVSLSFAPPRALSHRDFLRSQLARIREARNKPQGLFRVHAGFAPPRALHGARIRQAHNRPQGLFCVLPHPLFRNPAAKPLMVR